MPQGAILYRWGQVVPGREEQALTLFSESVELFDDFLKNNQIIGHWPYISTTRAGGYWLVHGEMEQLGAIQMLPEVQALHMKGQGMLTEWTAEWLMGGSAEELAEPMEMYSGVVSQLD